MRGAFGIWGHSSRLQRSIRFFLAFCLLTGTVATGTNFQLPAMAQVSQIDANRLEDLQASRNNINKEKASLETYISRLGDIREQWESRLRASQQLADDDPKKPGEITQREAKVEDYARQIESLREKLLDQTAQIAELDTKISEVRGVIDKGKREYNTSQQNADNQANSAAAPFKIRLETVPGFWRNPENDKVYSILQEHPDVAAWPYKLMLYSPGGRIWKGNFEPDEVGSPHRIEDARLTFRYKPRADEMNADIPPWARQQIEGQLEWRLAFDEECCPLRLKGKFFPGEVKWNEASSGQAGSAEIIGEGEPREFKLDVDKNYAFGAIPWAKISLRPIVAPHTLHVSDTGLRKYPQLAKAQLFHIDLRMNKAASELWVDGRTAQVEIKNGRSGQSEIVNLTRTLTASEKGILVSYTTTVPVAFADQTSTLPDRDPPVLSQPWILKKMGDLPGSRLNLSVQNEDLLEFKFRDQKFSVEVLDSLAKLFLDNYMVLLGRLEGRLRTIRYDQEALESARQWAGQRLKMAYNLRKILANVRGSSSDNGVFPDSLSWRIADAYLGQNGRGLLIDDGTDASSSEPEERRRQLTLREKRARVNSYGDLKSYFDGVDWATAGEADGIVELVNGFWDKSLDDFQLSYVSNVLKDMPYSFITSTTSPVPIPFLSNVLSYDFLVTSMTGRNAAGKRVTNNQRKLALILALLSTGGEKMTRRFGADFVDKLTGPGTNFRRPASIPDTPNYPKNAGLTPKVVRNLFTSSYPKNLPAKNASSIRNAMLKQHTKGSLATASGNRRTPALAGIRPPRSQSDDGINWGPSAVIRHADDGNGQCFGACNLTSSIGYGLKKELGIDAGDMTIMLLGAATGTVNFKGRSATNHKFNHGIDDPDVFLMLDTAGYESRYLARATLTLETLRSKMVEKWRPMVRVQLDGDPDQLHSVLVLKIDADAEGKIATVTFRDTSGSRARIVELAAKTFTNMIYRGPEVYRMAILFRPGKDGINPKFAEMARNLAQNKDLNDLDLRPGGWNLLNQTGPATRVGTDAGRPPRSQGQSPWWRDRQIKSNAALQVAPWSYDYLVIKLRENLRREARRKASEYGKIYDEKAKPLEFSRTHETTMATIVDLINQGPNARLQLEGKASFASGGKIPAARQGGMLLRVKDEIEKAHIEWRGDEPALGLHPLYYPMGTDAAKKAINPSEIFHKTYVPIRHLEWFDAENASWKPLNLQSLDPMVSRLLGRKAQNEE